MGPALLCYDGSTDAAMAIERAGELILPGPAIAFYAWLAPSALLLQGRLLEVAHPLGPAAEEFDAVAAEEAEKLAAEGARLAAEAGFEATPEARRASFGVWRTVVDAAEELDARIVVVGSHGRSGAKSKLLGSVSHGIVNHCRRPVLVSPRRGEST